MFSMTVKDITCRYIKTRSVHFGIVIPLITIKGVNKIVHKGIEMKSLV